MPKDIRKPPPGQVIALGASPSKRRGGAAAAAANRKRTAPETIVLDCDDDANEKIRADYAATTIKAFAESKKNKTGSDTSASRGVGWIFGAGTGKGGRRQSPRQPSSKTETLPDAIDVDNMAATPGVNDASGTYRRVLGPLRFDFIDEFSHHAFLSEKPHPSMQKQMPALYKELLEYRLNLPSETSGSIFVRALESRMGIIRALITGPDETPYAHGCFLFDIYLHDYPKCAPKVKFLTTAQAKVRFNPNLYNCGKVCLSLLGTWSGPGWVANKSTLLQVLVSIQGLILVSEPYYNEPGYTKNAQSLRQSDAYTKNIRHYTLKHAIGDHLDRILQKRRQNMSSEFSEFHDVFISHFFQQTQAICLVMDEWVAQDKTLKPTADTVRQKLLQLVEEQERLQKSKPSAKRASPEIFEINDD